MTPQEALDDIADSVRRAEQWGYEYVTTGRLKSALRNVQPAPPVLDSRAQRYLQGLLREYVDENPDRSDADYALELVARLESL